MHRYEINEAHLPKGSPIENARERLALLIEAKGILNDNRLWSASRVVAAMGFYNMFYSIFEIIMQAKKGSAERAAYEQWKSQCPDQFYEFDSLYHSFRNKMTHQGASIPPSYIDWQDDIMNDTAHPVKVFPIFMRQISIDGKVVAEFTLPEWADHCIVKIDKALRFIEEAASQIRSQMNKPAS